MCALRAAPVPAHQLPQGRTIPECSATFPMSNPETAGQSEWAVWNKPVSTRGHFLMKSSSFENGCISSLDEICTTKEGQGLVSGLGSASDSFLVVPSWGLVSSPGFSPLRLSLRAVAVEVRMVSRFFF